jgi:serine/threonine-protein kinase SRPK3
MLRAKDPTIWSSIEQEIEHPSPRKIVDDRTIYRSRFLLHTRWAAHPIITDFGAARFGDPGEMHRGDVMPGIHRAPEVILDTEWDWTRSGIPRSTCGALD